MRYVDKTIRSLVRSCLTALPAPKVCHIGAVQWLKYLKLFPCHVKVYYQIKLSVCYVKYSING